MPVHRLRRERKQILVLVVLVALAETGVLEEVLVARATVPMVANSDFAPETPVVLVAGLAQP
jgi:hypothetical protein